MKSRTFFLLVSAVLISACSFLGFIRSEEGNAGSKTGNVTQDHKIVYAADGAGLSRDIYVMRPDGSDKINLTRAPGYRGNEHPAWSPDGTKIAFIGANFQTEDDIYVMNQDGSNLLRLTDHPGRDYDLDWSPDGTQLVYVSQSTEESRVSDLYAVNTDGAGLVRLTDLGEGCKYPDWSPDGGKILFEFDFEVAVINRDGSNLQFFTRMEDGCTKRPTWSPDGSQIAFTGCTAQEGGAKKRSLFVMTPDENQVNKLMETENELCCPSWSPDGKHIALSISDGDTGKYYQWVINQDGTGLRQITTVWGVFTGEQIGWSPDGSRIIFEGADEGSDWDVHIAPIDGSEAIRLTDTEYFEGDPDWRK